MTKHAFLSDAWLDAVLALQREYAENLPPPSAKAKINQVITGAPFGEGTVHIHTDTTSGTIVTIRGHAEDAKVKVTIDYETARRLVLEGDQQVAMQAFMQGRIRAEGDVSILMIPPPPKNDAQKELEQKLRDLTE